MRDFFRVAILAILAILVIPAVLLQAQSAEKNPKDLDRATLDTPKAKFEFLGKPPGKSDLHSRLRALRPVVKAAPTQSSILKRSESPKKARFNPRAKSATKSSLSKVQPKDKPSNVETKTRRVSIQAASFQGVQPGTTTANEIETLWGKPESSSTKEGMDRRIYLINPFQRVEVTLNQNKVVMIIISLKKYFPPEVIAKQLQFAGIRSAFVRDEQGRLMGQAFPERGVMFSYAPKINPPQVAQVVLEPISVEPFLLRVESDLVRYEANLRDLNDVIKIKPDHARAYWLRCRVLCAVGQGEKALDAVDEAIRLAPEVAQFQLARAKILGQLGQFQHAIKLTRDLGLNKPLDRLTHAQKLSQLGDLLSAAPGADHQKAVGNHIQAIRLADTLQEHPHTEIRRLAKRVLVEAHLGVARGIASGHWKNREKVVPKWIEWASIFADDLVENEGADAQLQLLVSRSAVAVCVGIKGKLDPARWVSEMFNTSEKLLEDTRDPLQKKWIQWQMGSGLFDALKIQYQSGRHESVVDYGQRALTYLAPASGDVLSMPERDYIVGQVYYFIGASHAAHNKDHDQAVSWYAQAIPRLEKPVPPTISALELGNQGEAFVNMGLSYWKTSQHNKAVQLTEDGVHLIEQAVKQELLEPSALVVAYSNLSKMHQQLGNRQKAIKYAKLAARSKTSKKSKR